VHNVSQWPNPSSDHLIAIPAEVEPVTSRPYVWPYRRTTKLSCRAICNKKTLMRFFTAACAGEIFLTHSRGVSWSYALL